MGDPWERCSCSGNAMISSGDMVAAARVAAASAVVVGAAATKKQVLN